MGLKLFIYILLC